MKLSPTPLNKDCPGAIRSSKPTAFPKRFGRPLWMLGAGSEEEYFAEHPEEAGRKPKGEEE
jgi:hypothetical protein